MNQSIFTAIRIYLEKDHREWDLNFPIELALEKLCPFSDRSPFMALFGYNMFTLGSDYKLAKQFISLDDSELILLENKDNLRQIRETMKRNML